MFTSQDGKYVYVRRPSSYQPEHIKGEIVKTTPKGFVDVQLGGVTLRRFNPEGREVAPGVSRYSAYELDTIPFDERAAKIERDKQELEAARKVLDLKIDITQYLPCDIRYWNKDVMDSAIENMRDKLNQAREIVNAI